MEAFEKKERIDSANKGKDWYKKADEMYKMALSINPDIINSEGQKHIAMLIGVRKKMMLIKKNSA
ncbi:MAG: hypothetical protein WD016_03940 [Balneolaceae bacterium]